MSKENVDDIMNFYNKKQQLKDTKRESINTNVQIVEEQKELLDYRCGLVTQEEHSSPRYYFANKSGKRIPVIGLNGEEIYDSFYSIEKIDEMHYEVSSLDFTYGPGLDYWMGIYEGNVKNASHCFKFHYGIVSVQDDKVNLVVPIVYKEFKQTNSNILISYADDTFKPVIVNLHVKEVIRIDGKLGAVNLDPNSEFYGLNIIPPVLDHFEDFDLQYEGYARVGIGDFTGYLAKEMDMNRYQNYMKLYAAYKKGIVDMKTYRENVKDAIKEVLISEEEMLEKFSEKEKIEDKPKQLGAKTIFKENNNQ